MEIEAGCPLHECAHVPVWFRNFETQTRHKSEDEVGRKRQRERFSEEQVAAMTQLAERAGWSITAISWEERVKFCEEYAVTKVGWTPSVTSLIL